MTVTDEFDRPLDGDNQREAKAARDDRKGTDLTNKSRYTDDELRSIDSFEAALALLGDTPVVDVGEFGNGFTVLDDKNLLVGVPFVILSFDINPDGKFGEFATMVVVTAKGQKYIVNDGSTGVANQLLKIKERMDRVPGALHRGIACRNGLRVSNYTYEDDKGKTLPASTFYLDTSA